MKYTVCCLSSLDGQLTFEILSLPIEIIGKSKSHGYTTITIRCDAATAATIAERWHVLKADE